MTKAILILSLILSIALPAYGMIDQCDSDWGTSCYGMRVTICPQGDFELLSDGCGGGDDYIWVRVVDTEGSGITGIPTADYWLQACDPAQELCLCSFSFAANAPTDATGYAEFSGRIAGGGCILTGGVGLTVQGKILVENPACVDVTCVDIVIVSPDLNADCFVNLSDLGMFGLSYNLSLGQPGYDPCCDFNDDDNCNLSDFAHIGEHYQHEC
ncbi:MAG: hypothetical protein KOO63_02070 [Bacteroidales bacterium]|nr:hypothetical protein [Candidatus Latescibacterota bacterium]